MTFRRLVSSVFSRVGFVRAWETKTARRATVSALLASILAIGCATGEYAYVTTISTGERIQIPLVNGAPLPAKKGNLTVMHAGLVPNPNPDDKKLKYLFHLEDKSLVPPKAVVVEDVTDDHAILMVEDLAPKFTEARWTGASPLYGGEDPAMAWVGPLGDSTRVFRFTVTAADGSKTTLDQAWIVPSWAKVGMRKALGIKLGT